MTHDLSARLEAWLAAFNAKDLDTYLGFYSDDIELYGYAPQVMRRSEVRDYYETYLETFDMASTADELIWDGHRVAVRFTANAKQIKPFDGIEPSGRQVSWLVMSILHWRDGKIVRRYSLQDMEKVRAALRER